MDPVPTHYVDRDGAAMAYQVIGDGQCNRKLARSAGKQVISLMFCRWV